MITVAQSKFLSSRNLDIKEHCNLLTVNEPKPYHKFFLKFPDSINLKPVLKDGNLDMVHIFVRTKKELIVITKRTIPLLKENGVLWISIPKNSADIITELNLEFIYKYMVKTKLVNTKFFNLDNDWYALKYINQKF